MSKIHSYKSLKKELIKTFEGHLPLKDDRELTPDVLEEEIKILDRILKVITPVLKFIDNRIIISEKIFTFYYSYTSSFNDDVQSWDIDTPKEEHITKYYKENNKIVKGIPISIDIINVDTKYFGMDTSDNEIEYNIIESTESTAIVIYLLRNGKIMKFDRYRLDRHLLDYEHRHNLENPQKLMIKEFPQYNSPKKVIQNILLAYHRAITDNENKFPILKKSLTKILEIKDKL